MTLFSFDTLADPVGTLKAEVQSRVGEFLQMNSKLRPYVNSNDAQTRQVASTYMQQQMQLEGELPTMLEIANNLSMATVLSTDGIAVGAFANRLANHMSNVNAFLGPSAANAVLMDDPLGLGISSKTLMIGGAIAGVGMLMGRTMLGIVGGVGFVVANKSGMISVNI